MPCTPIAVRASRTSSSLKGLIMAMTIFMNLNPRLGPVPAAQDEAIPTLGMAARRSPASYAGVCESSLMPVLREYPKHLKPQRLLARAEAGAGTLVNRRTIRRQGCTNFDR